MYAKYGPNYDRDSKHKLAFTIGYVKTPNSESSSSVWHKYVLSFIKPLCPKLMILAKISEVVWYWLKMQYADESDAGASNSKVS